MFTDNTYSLTKRHFPAWAPLPARQSRRWAELEAITCRDARYVFVPSDLVRDTMIADYGCEPERVVRVGFGTAIYEPELPPRSWDTQVALFVGIQFARKGGPTLLEAWAEVARELPDAELWVVGPKSGPDGRASSGRAVARLRVGPGRARGPVPAGVGVRAAVDLRPVPERAARGDGPRAARASAPTRAGSRRSSWTARPGCSSPVGEPEPLAQALVERCSATPQRRSAWAAPRTPP